jgi:hypothetical protein
VPSIATALGSIPSTKEESEEEEKKEKEEEEEALMVEFWADKYKL